MGCPQKTIMGAGLKNVTMNIVAVLLLKVVEEVRPLDSISLRPPIYSDSFSARMIPLQTS